jgi:hypothetical protein
VHRSREYSCICRKRQKFSTDFDKCKTTVYTRIDEEDGMNHILLGILIPPSNLSTTPFSMIFSMLCVTSCANSWGLPGLTVFHFISCPIHSSKEEEGGEEYVQGNSITLVRLALTLSLIIAVILLSNRLGATVTTLIPYRARSRVIGSVKEAIAPFEAA